MHNEPNFNADYSVARIDAAASQGRQRKRRRPGRLWRLGTVLSGLLSFSIVVVAGVFAGIYFLKLHMKQPGPLATEKTLLVSTGSGLSAIARVLEGKGVIDSAEMFIIGVSVDRAQTRLRAGEYRFAPGISMKQVMVKLITGQSVKHKVTLAEGLTSFQIVERLKADKVLVGDIDMVPADGTLLPETYLFQRGQQRAGIIKEMVVAQRKLLDNLWDNRAKNLPLKTRAEALILASIVEKETGIASERRRVAAVFVNRLRRNIRLQSDPTIIYGITGGKGPLGRALLRSDIDKKTSYNTYQIDGLPPTPIANPGRASIEAVLDPIESNELFFVADGSGGHVFAETLNQHQKNVVNWRKIEAERRKAAAKKAKDAASTGTVPAANAGKKTDANQ